MEIPCSKFSITQFFTVTLLSLYKLTPYFELLYPTILCPLQSIVMPSFVTINPWLSVLQTTSEPSTTSFETVCPQISGCGVGEGVGVGVAVGVAVGVGVGVGVGLDVGDGEGVGVTVGVGDGVGVGVGVAIIGRVVILW